jgi:hypothetical protein
VKRHSRRAQFRPAPAGCIVQDGPSVTVREDNMMFRSRSGAARRVMLFALVSLAVALPSTAHAQSIPDRLSDAEFWHMFADFSEPGGAFQSENLLSNETGFQMVIPDLVRTVHQGGVYVGVGPEQNFTYIVALHPRMAFIIDIRHQNAVHHLLYKALIELSDNRADFLSRLFSRPRPAGLGTNAPVDSLFAAFEAVRPDSVLYDKTLAAVKERLVRVHGFALNASELSLLEHNFDAFYWAGPAIRYNFNVNPSRGFGNMPNYTTLMTATDNAGMQRSYLASDSNYQALRDIERRNMLVPLTGNFAGPKALRTVGDYVRGHHAVVTAMYCSNVEQYLFQNGVWFNFEANIATLPLDSTSTFIRSGRPGGPGAGYGYGYGGGRGGRGGMATSLLQSMQQLVLDAAAGKIHVYQDVLQSSRQSTLAPGSVRLLR